MKRKKSVLIGIVFGITIITLVGFVSASWLSDLFKAGDKEDAGEGELDAAKPVNVNVAVSGGYPAPDIISISSLNSKMTEASVVVADRTLAAGGANKATTFDFYVWSSAGSGALPQGVQITTSNVYVTLVYIGSVPATQPGGKQLTSKGTLCTSSVIPSFNTVTGDDIAGNDAIFGTKPDVVKYSCTVQVPPYTIYGNPAINWDVRAYVEDLSAPTPNKEGWEYVDANTGNPFNAGAGHELPIRQTYFNRLVEWKIDNNAGNTIAEFGTVPYGDTIDKQPTALSQPRIVNLGNAFIDKTQVQASDLQDVDNNDATYIPATWFYSDPITPCDTGVSINLDATLKEVMQNDIAYGPTGNNQDLKICLKKILAGPPAGVTSQSYSTSASGGTAWNVDTTPCNSAGGICP